MFVFFFELYLKDVIDDNYLILIKYYLIKGLDIF